MGNSTTPSNHEYFERFNAAMNQFNAKFEDAKKKVIIHKHMHKCFGIKKVIFNVPATIILWEDGTKTVVKCGDHDIFDPEKGLAMAIAKKALGNKYHYYDVFNEWVPDVSVVIPDGVNVMLDQEDVIKAEEI